MARSSRRLWLILLIAAIAAAVALRHFAVRGRRESVAPRRTEIARNLLLVTIDTLRADHVGAYGYAGNTTPALDRIARSGTWFSHAYAPAPVTLTSHASMLTGRYPPGHGARDNGMPLARGIPTLATVLHDAGFETAAFIAAFPLDRRFGLATGFDLYSDRMPRDAHGKPLNERPGREVVDEALAWLGPRLYSRKPFFAWVHLFEPHAPYGDPANAGGRTALERYDDEIRAADTQVGRLIERLGDARAETVVVAVGDHGEAFGEHGEMSHSVFVYDTTLRVPWIMMGPGIAARTASIDDPVGLIDLAPSVLALLGKATIAGSDGIDLRPALVGRRLPEREIYAESFSPLFDFGWSPLRSVRRGPWKVIAAPRPELYDIEHDAGETIDMAAQQPAVRQRLVERADTYSRPESASGSDAFAAGNRDTAARLQALGYLHGRGSRTGAPPENERADPKDRRQIAARMALVTSGELRGGELKAALEVLARDEPRNPQVQLRLGDCLLAEGAFAEAEAHFSAAIAGGLPSVDALLGLATSLAATGRIDAARRTLERAVQREPDNPVIAANIGILEARAGRLEPAIRWYLRALDVDPDLHEARFNLALAYADAGRRPDAEREARSLLQRLPTDATQRSEVERLLAVLHR